MSAEVAQEEPASSPVPALEVESSPEQSSSTADDDTDIVRLEAAHRSGKPGEEAEAGPDSTAEHEREGSTESGDAEDARNASEESPEKEAESTDGPAESNEDNDCGFCVFMKQGPCGKRFSRWEDCVEGAEKSGDNIVEKCWQMTQTLKQCMEVNPDYYGPVLQAEKSLLEEEIAAEAKATVNQETENVETEGSPEEGRQSPVSEEDVEAEGSPNEGRESPVREEEEEEEEEEQLAA